MSDEDTFPFGHRAMPQSPRQPVTGAARCFVLGVLAMATINRRLAAIA